MIGKNLLGAEPLSVSGGDVLVWGLIMGTITASGIPEAIAAARIAKLTDAELMDTLRALLMMQDD